MIVAKFEPMPDITAYELSLILRIWEFRNTSIFASLVSALPIQARRHFKPEEHK
jgi:hypothetical protein